MDLQLERWRQAAEYKYQVALTGQLKDAWEAYERAHPDRRFPMVVREALRAYLKNYLTERPL